MRRFLTIFLGQAIDLASSSKFIKQKEPIDRFGTSPEDNDLVVINTFMANMGLTTGLV